jgi:capsule biosynthesis phosphatase
MKKLVVDIDNTICTTENGDYENSKPVKSIIRKLNQLYDKSWYIILFTSRNMRTHTNNIGRINALTLPLLIKWLEKHGVQYHEIHVGKPWAQNGFYVDDRAIRPKEFIENSMEQLEEICNNDLVAE